MEWLRERRRGGADTGGVRWTGEKAEGAMRAHLDPSDQAPEGGSGDAARKHHHEPMGRPRPPLARRGGVQGVGQQGHVSAMQVGQHQSLGGEQRTWQEAARAAALVPAGRGARDGG